MSTVFTQVPYPNVQTVRTNECVNPSFEVDFAGWSLSGVGSPTVTRRLSTTSPAGGSYVARVATTAAAVGGAYLYEFFTHAVLPTQIWSVSAYLRGTPGRIGQIIGRVGASQFPGANVTLSSTVWQRASSSFTVPAGGTVMDTIVQLQATTAGDYMDIDGVLVEINPVPSPGSYFDGSTDPAPGVWHKWTAAVQQSTSTRTAQAPITGEANTYTTDSVMGWDETNTRRVTEHLIIGQPDPIVTVASATRTMDTRRGTFETFHTTEADARAFVQFLYANAIMVADPLRTTLAPYIIVRDASASPFGDEKRRWSVRASWTEVNPAGLGL